MYIKKVWNNLWGLNRYYNKPNIKLTADVLLDVLQFLSYGECKKNQVVSKVFSRVVLERMRQRKLKLLQVERYMRCIYTPEDFEKVVTTGKAVIILKVYRGSIEKMSSQCAKAYLSAIELLQWEHEISTQWSVPIRFVLDFSDKNRNNMTYHYYYQNRELTQVVVIAEVDGILTPYSFRRELVLKIIDFALYLSKRKKIEQ